MAGYGESVSTMFSNQMWLTGVEKWHSMVVMFLVGIKLTKPLYFKSMTSYKPAVLVRMDVSLAKVERIWSGLFFFFVDVNERALMNINEVKILFLKLLLVFWLSIIIMLLLLWRYIQIISISFRSHFVW